MKPNVLVCQSEKELENQFATDFIVNIDGKKALTLRQFYEEIADLLEIPNFGFTLDSLDNALNDLQWLDEKRIVLYFTNTNELISKERDSAKFLTVINMLDAAAEDWKWTGDDAANDKEIIIVFEDSQRIKKILKMENVDYSSMEKLK